MSHTRVLFLLLAVVLGGARTADAQLLGYAIGGPAGFTGFFGSSSAGVHAAGGAEALVRGTAGIGGEYGIIAHGGAPLFVFSANGVLHVWPATRRVSPFVTGGYTHMSSGEGSFESWNAGAGVDLWPRDRVGVRVEFRNHVRPDSRGTVHYWAIRAGVVVR